MTEEIIAANQTADDAADTQTGFPVEALPPVIANMAKAISDATQTPPTLSACCCLGVLSASIGRGLAVNSSSSGQITHGNVYIMASAESGTGKSQAFRHAAEPLTRYESALTSDWQNRILPGAAADLAIIARQIEQKQKGASKVTEEADRLFLRSELADLEKRKRETEKLTERPTLVAEDVTQEKLAVLMQANGECIASMTSDGGNIVNNLLGRYSKKADQTDETLYLKGFSVEGVTVERMGRLPVTLSRPCMSALWLVQPDKVDRLLANRTLTEGGLIPRMLVCHTNCEPMLITGPLPRIPAYHSDRYADLMQSCLRTYRQSTETAIITPDDDAMAAMIDYHNEVVTRRKAELRDVTSYAARWAENAWRLAVCLHAALHADRAASEPMTADTAENAITITRYFAGEQLAILSAGREAAKADKQAEILLLAGRSEGQGITTRDLQRKRIARTAGEAAAILGRMEEAGQLVRAIVKTKGGESIRFNLPPPKLV